MTGQTRSAAWKHPLHTLDRVFLHVAEFFFGPRESWAWWQRKLGRIK